MGGWGAGSASSMVVILSCNHLAVWPLIQPQTPGTAGRPDCSLPSRCCEPVPCSPSLQWTTGEWPDSRGHWVFPVPAAVCTKPQNGQPGVPARAAVRAGRKSPSQGKPGHRHMFPGLGTCDLRNVWAGKVGGSWCPIYIHTHLRTQISDFTLRGQIPSA